MKRRTFCHTALTTLAATTAGALNTGSASSASPGPGPSPKKAAPAPVKPPLDALPQGKIGKLSVSRMLLGGNLLTHYTHSRDLKYVYKLTEKYNTDAKILETLALAEQHGINTVSMHNPPRPIGLLKEYRRQGGKIQWIICPTAKVGTDDYVRQVGDLVDSGCEAIYLWGVHADPLAASGRVDQIAKAVEIAHEFGVPSGVGCHDLNVVVECEKHKVPCDFYIKTFHHHKYRSGPKPGDLKGPHAELPGYWCRDPEKTIEVMKGVSKPWIAFKIMAAGAIPPENAFKYAFNHGADHALVGMFDFEIAEDVQLMKSVLANTQRTRPWCS